jgi:large subunit ribosomal protein LP2
MRYVAAYLLAVLGGKASPTADDVKAILASVGVETDAKALDIVIKELKGKDLEQLIAEGQKKLASMPSGGAAPVAAAASAAPAAAADKGGKGKKEEKKEESESDGDMGMGLFD